MEKKIIITTIVVSAVSVMIYIYLNYIKKEFFYYYKDKNNDKIYLIPGKLTSDSGMNKVSIPVYDNTDTKTHTIFSDGNDLNQIFTKLEKSPQAKNHIKYFILSNGAAIYRLSYKKTGTDNIMALSRSQKNEWAGMYLCNNGIFSKLECRYFE